VLHRPRLLRHLVAGCAASAAVVSRPCRTALGGRSPCRSISQVTLYVNKRRFRTPSRKRLQQPDFIARISEQVESRFGAYSHLGPLQALQNIAVINGRPSIWPDLTERADL
jgi:hypothetical protein